MRVAFRLRSIWWERVLKSSPIDFPSVAAELRFGICPRSEGHAARAALGEVEAADARRLDFDRAEMLVGRLGGGALQRAGESIVGHLADGDFCRGVHVDVFSGRVSLGVGLAIADWPPVFSMEFISTAHA